MRLLLRVLIAIGAVATVIAGPTAAPAVAMELVPQVPTSLSGSFSESDWVRLEPDRSLSLLLTGHYRGDVVFGAYDCPESGHLTFQCARYPTSIDGTVPGPGGLPSTFLLTKTTTIDAVATFGDLEIPPGYSTGYAATGWVATIFDGLTLTCGGYGQRADAEWDYLWGAHGACSAA